MKEEDAFSEFMSNVILAKPEMFIAFNGEFVLGIIAIGPHILCFTQQYTLGATKVWLDMAMETQAWESESAMKELPFDMYERLH